MATLSSSSSTCNMSERATMVGLDSIPAKRVRVVAKIRGFSDQESLFLKGSPWISVNKPNGEASGSVSFSFGDQSSWKKDSYALDSCYEQSEGNDFIFSREVKPLIPGVLDGSNNATVFAYGARNSGKTSLIQGSCESPGLAALAMAKILLEAEGRQKSVSISLYEVYQDHVCDLLDPKQKAVFVLEDKEGKVQLKGLSRVPVRAISDFEKLYLGLNLNKPPQKSIAEPRKSHKGLIVYISSLDTLRIGKMNFVDLAGYEDVRRKSTDGINFSEQNKTNATVYAFLNVIHALSANISHVPYRESKLARILKDSLGKLNRVVMIACLSPIFCQDSIYMVKLASRSSQKINATVSDSIKKINGINKPKMVSLIKSQTPKTVCAPKMRQVASHHRVPLSEKKVNSAVVPFSVKGRKLFEEKKKSSASDKKTSIETESSVVTTASIVKTLADEEASSVVNVSDTTGSSCNENAFPFSHDNSEQTLIAEKDNQVEHDQFTFAPTKDVIVVGSDESEVMTPGFDSSTKTKSSSSRAKEGHNMEKENNDSPPISAKLQELSNSMKAFCSGTPFSMKLSEKSEANVLVPVETVEPKTPMTERTVNFDARSNCKNVNSTGLKSSIVQEFLKFMNTADKEELKKLKGIGEKRATWVLELRQESPEPFKSVDDLKNIGLAGKMVKDMMKLDGPLFD